MIPQNLLRANIESVGILISDTCEKQFIYFKSEGITSVLNCDQDFQDYNYKEYDLIDSNNSVNSVFNTRKTIVSSFSGTLIGLPSISAGNCMKIASVNLSGNFLALELHTNLYEYNLEFILE